MKPCQTTRRSFVKLAAAGVMLAGSGAPRKVSAQSPQDLPPLDGQLLFDDVGRQAAAVDYGGHVRPSPIAVLKARSATDVARMVAYANKRGLKIAMRGQGHSQYGRKSKAASSSTRARRTPCAGMATTRSMPSPARSGATWRN
jgi:hypothetical protein